VCNDAQRNAHTSIQAKRRQSGLPCAMVLTGSFALSPVTGLCCHRCLADRGASQPGWADALPQNVTPASGRQDHTTSPYATRLRQTVRPASAGLVEGLAKTEHALFVHAPASLTGNPPCDHLLRADAVASIASRPTFLTIAKRPLPGRDGD